MSDKQTWREVDVTPPEDGGATALWSGRFCVQHLAEVRPDDDECDYADEWADEEMRCKVESVAVLRNPGSSE